MESVLLTLAVLACPIVMGTMMILMMRRGHHPNPADSHSDSHQKQLDTLHAEVERLRRERGPEHRTES